MALTTMQEQSQLDRNPGLQAMRGIAALLVFFQHAINQSVPFGAGPERMLYALNLGGIGVFSFFVLSAFLISNKAWDPPRRFLLDRARRIFPGLWAAILLAWLLDHFTTRFHVPTWQLFLLLPLGEAPKAAMPYWTLYFEVVLYLAIFLLARLSPRSVAPGILAWGVVAWLLQPPYSEHYSFPDLQLLFLSAIPGAFAAGILVRWHAARPVAPARRVPMMVALAILALVPFVIMSVVNIFPQYGFLYGWVAQLLPKSLQPSLGLFYFVIGSALAVRAAAMWKASGWMGRMLRGLGDMSYGFYLIHIAFLVAFRHLLLLNGVTMNFWAAMLVLTLLALPCSVAFGWAEFRMQVFLKDLLRARRPTAVVMPGLAVSSGR
jgi:peptidoglycan/LPS O-acetylase OafA/YrhL